MITPYPALFQPLTIGHDDIERVIGDFAAAAGRAQRGGLDGCELSVLGHLGGQFWSPAVNRRTDGYGGSIANRARFTLETLEAMRERAPERFLIGMRFTMDELVEEGLREDDALDRRHARRRRTSSDLNASGRSTTRA